jgi:antitoxin HicB
LGLNEGATIFDYPVILTPDEGTVAVIFVGVPEAINFGVDEDEALLNAMDALENGLSFYVDACKPLPAPSKPKRGQKNDGPDPLNAPGWACTKP